MYYVFEARNLACQAWRTQLYWLEAVLNSSRHDFLLGGEESHAIATQGKIALQAQGGVRGRGRQAQGQIYDVLLLKSHTALLLKGQSAPLLKKHIGVGEVGGTFLNRCPAI